MKVSITFLGATGTVSGSRYMLEADGYRLLVDCGLFEGVKRIRSRNWQPFPIEPASIDAVALTDAHLDHCGYLPCLMRDGFKGPVWCSHGTRDLCKVLLPDFGESEEELANFLNRSGGTRHSPARALYTGHVAQQSLDRFRSVGFDQMATSGPFNLIFCPSGSNIGSSTLLVEAAGRHIAFSGNVGRIADPLMRSPRPLSHCDVLILNSTYGDRLHPEIDPLPALGEIVRRTASRGGVLLIPTQLIGRAQALLYLLKELKWQRQIPDLPIFVDSSMACDAAAIMSRHLDELRLDEDLCHAACTKVTYVRIAEESAALDRRAGPMVIISPTGMLTSGRILHHLAVFGPAKENTILLTNYQPEGTRGRALKRGVEQLKMLGRYYPMSAEVVLFDALSNQADHAELVAWLAGSTLAPDRVFITHGEPAEADALRRYLQDQMGWSTWAPEYLSSFEL